RDALPELQRARQNANARLKAMNALGQCYRELGMFDLAAKQLEEAAREIATMDATKKEIVYNLGLVYERMGNREKSLACMKQIYEADYGYKDVATRVESSYAAEKNASESEVKNFGARMVKDHSKANEDLKAIAKEENVEWPAEKAAGKWKSDKDYMDAMVKDHEKDLAAFEKEAKDGSDSKVK